MSLSYSSRSSSIQLHTLGFNSAYHATAVDAGTNCGKADAVCLFVWLLLLFVAVACLIVVDDDDNGWKVVAGCLL